MVLEEAGVGGCTCRTHELTAPESGLATLQLKDGSEYGFRPTIQDSSPWNRIVITIFRTATASAPTTVLEEHPRSKCPSLEYRRLRLTLSRRSRRRLVIKPVSSRRLSSRAKASTSSPPKPTDAYRANRLLVHVRQTAGTARAVVWAHNSHLGDVRASYMATIGQFESRTGTCRQLPIGNHQVASQRRPKTGLSGDFQSGESRDHAGT
jgi:hypothetical protein